VLLLGANEKQDGAKAGENSIADVYWMFFVIN
jgi:hypothetical protein